MKKTCGTCNFQVDCRAGKSSVEILCAHDNEWRKDNSPDCGKWTEHISSLSPKDRISLVGSDRQTSIALDANRLAAEANVFARSASRWAKIAAIIAAIAIIISTATIIIITILTND